MKYAYEDMYDYQFEKLIVILCQELFGVGAQGFANGPDGGRDAKFVGTAEIFPSKVAPWSGTTIIQAKHTNGFNRSFSECDFFSVSSNKTVIGVEIPRIKNLHKNKQIDNYILFANRRLSANTEEDIRNYISKMCGIPKDSIYLSGSEQLDNWLARFPNVLSSVNLDPIDSPLIINSEDICNIIEKLAQQWTKIKKALDDPPTPRITYEDKNILNNMTEEYAKELIKRYLKDTEQIRSFLADPKNKDILNLYNSVIEELGLKIIAKRNDYQTFDNVMEYILDLLFNRDAVLRKRQNKRLTRVVLFYMYWNCDIGKEDK